MDQELLNMGQAELKLHVIPYKTCFCPFLLVKLALEPVRLLWIGASGRDIVIKKLNTPSPDIHWVPLDFDASPLCIVGHFIS